ncbi:MAG: ABC transporter permease [Vicinamibacteria bacterium]
MNARRATVLSGVREAIGMGLSAIVAYKLRAGLTILGVVMGIMTVTGMSSIVAGLNASMAKQIENLGSSVVFVRPWGPGENLSNEERRRRRGLSENEVKAIIEHCPSVKDISPMEILRYDTIKTGNAKVQSATLLGTTESFSPVHDLYVDKGRFMSGLDVSRGTRVAVIGYDVAESLYGPRDPIDKEMMIDGLRFNVIGVLERRGKFLGQNRDNDILIPLGSLGKRDPFFNFLVADLKPVSTEKMDDAVEEVRSVLRRQRKLKFMAHDNFMIFTQDTLTNLYNQITGGIYMVMIAISSIGLLVGGVGVMNIMLVSVTERTREIGVRKALGATKRDILTQFLTEAMTLTGVGGILGILIGGGLAALVNTFSPFPAVMQTTWVTIAFAVAILTGLTFGLWPAWKAAGLDPIEALRYE